MWVYVKIASGTLEAVDLGGVLGIGVNVLLLLEEEEVLDGASSLSIWIVHCLGALPPNISKVLHLYKNIFRITKKIEV
jgi:hypothetical protein